MRRRCPRRAAHHLRWQSPDGAAPVIEQPGLPGERLAFLHDAHHIAVSAFEGAARDHDDLGAEVVDLVNEGTQVGAPTRQCRVRPR